MFLQANPTHRKLESEKKDIAKNYKPGDVVLPRVPTVQPDEEEEEDRRIMEEQGRGTGVVMGETGTQKDEAEENGVMEEDIGEPNPVRYQYQLCQEAVLVNHDQDQSHAKWSTRDNAADHGRRMRLARGLQRHTANGSASENESDQIPRAHSKTSQGPIHDHAVPPLNPAMRLLDLHLVDTWKLRQTVAAGGELQLTPDQRLRPTLGPLPVQGRRPTYHGEQDVRLPTFPTALNPRDRLRGLLLVGTEDAQLTQMDAAEQNIHDVMSQGKPGIEGTGIHVQTLTMDPRPIQHQISLLQSAAIHVTFESEPNSLSLYPHPNLYRSQIPREVGRGQGTKQTAALQQILNCPHRLLCPQPHDPLNIRNHR
ncbi:hypothetical protein FGG08_000955 [Glutinoglossum americanum]|uniref:Uncharacterized protein n=1 Tax=Glutinoglossum americanum TaxID=1670608 RepID=A0A9P8L5M4_9PEZI|nr:hypothetical protein FGG08_000955 [Glutinoglossum americanum]